MVDFATCKMAFSYKSEECTAVDKNNCCSEETTVDFFNKKERDEMVKINEEIALKVNSKEKTKESKVEYNEYIVREKYGRRKNINYCMSNADRMLSYLYKEQYSSLSGVEGDDPKDLQIKNFYSFYKDINGKAIPSRVGFSKEDENNGEKRAKKLKKAGFLKKTLDISKFRVDEPQMKKLKTMFEKRKGLNESLTLERANLANANTKKETDLANIAIKEIKKNIKKYESETYYPEWYKGLMCNSIKSNNLMKKLTDDIKNKKGYHIYYMTVTGAYHTLILEIDNTKCPDMPMYTIYDQHGDGNSSRFRFRKNKEFKDINKGIMETISVALVNFLNNKDNDDRFTNTRSRPVTDVKLWKAQRIKNKIKNNNRRVK